MSDLLRPNYETETETDTDTDTDTEGTSDESEGRPGGILDNLQGKIDPEDYTEEDLALREEQLEQRGGGLP